MKDTRWTVVTMSAALVVAGSAATIGCNGKSSSSSSTSSSEEARPLAAAQSDKDKDKSDTADDAAEVNPRLLRRFQPLPASTPDNASDAKLVELGRMLFFETRLSKDGLLSCNSCHDLATYGVDHHSASVGINGNVGSRNAPTVYNAAGHFVQFWDGRAPDLETQAKGPIVNPMEMGMANADAVEAAIKAIPGYAPLFAAAFPTEMGAGGGSSAPAISFDHVGTAIGAFERRLITPGRWDAFLRGDRQALNAAERKGLKTFLNSGCMVCHTGAYLGGSMFERVGVVEPWPNQRDEGRSGVTHTTADRMMFKVPSLRNVEKTAPYFHDGSAATLEQAVAMMGKHQLGLELTHDEIESITTWLKSLTCPLPPPDLITKPALPSGPKS